MDNNKISILKLIYENKDVLFGKFSDVLTHEMKINKWKQIAEQLRALDILKKDWKYLRDTTWQNWRKRTMVQEVQQVLKPQVHVTSFCFICLYLALSKNKDTIIT